MSERAGSGHKNQFRNEVNSAHDAVLTTDTFGFILSWNPAAEIHLGYEYAEALGQDLFNLIFFAHRDGERANNKNLKDGTDVFIFKSRSGKRFSATVTVSTYMNPASALSTRCVVIATTEAHLKSAELLRQYEALVHSSDDAIICKKLDGTVTSWNPAAERIFGYAEAEMLGSKMLKVFPQNKRFEETIILEKLQRGERIDHFQTIRRHKNGHLVHVSVSISPILDSFGKVIGAAKIARDITDKVERERMHAQFKALVCSSQDAIISMSFSGVIESWNDAAQKMFGYAAQDIIGENIQVLLPPERKEAEGHLIQRVRFGATIKHFRTVRMSREGKPVCVSISLSPVADEKGRARSISKIIRDITTEIESEEIIWKQANFDPLTGLRNRLSFERIVSNNLEAADKLRSRFAVMFIDLDNFKIYNDTYGHEFGDKLLVEVAKTLRAAIRSSDELSRFGGDEFTVCLNACHSVSVAETIARKIINAISLIRKIQGIAVALSVSIGVSFYPDDGEELITLQQKADKAMYEAKHKGKNQFRVFSELTNADADCNYALVEELSLAIERNQLSICIQPIFSRENFRLRKAEALVRWNHPERGSIAPDVFVPLAEKHGLIQSIGNWVLTECTRQLPNWISRFGSDFQLSVNKSPFEFYDHDDCIYLMKRLLRENNLQGRNLIIEITEHSLLDHTDVTERILASYNALGVKIAIDDFGTGYSSLSYLKRYDVDILKIDRLFVAEMTPNSIEFHLCQGIVNLAKSIGVQVVAEGVETDQQLALLLSMGCEFYQGYFFSKPVCARAFGLLPPVYAPETDNTQLPALVSG